MLKKKRNQIQPILEENMPIENKNNKIRAKVKTLA